jgi:hypothetical protein
MNDTIWLAASGDGRDARNWSKCKSCGQAIYWCKTAKNQKAIPFDVEPDVVERGAFGNERVDATRVHWATCPDADKFRRTAPAADRARKETAADGRDSEDVF